MAVGFLTLSWYRLCIGRDVGHSGSDSGHRPQFICSIQAELDTPPLYYSMYYLKDYIILILKGLDIDYNHRESVHQL